MKRNCYRTTYVNNNYIRIVWSLWNLIGVSAEYFRGACQISKRSDDYTINLTVSKVGENRFEKVERAIHRWPEVSLHKGSVMLKTCTYNEIMCHLWSYDDVIKWKQFPRYWPFVRGIHRSPVNFPHKCQWRGALMFSLICVWINRWVNNREAGDLRHHRTHYVVIVLLSIVEARVNPVKHTVTGFEVKLGDSWINHFITN